MKSPKKKVPPVHLLVAIDVSAAELVVALAPEHGTPGAVSTHANTGGGSYRAHQAHHRQSGHGAGHPRSQPACTACACPLALNQAPRVEVMVINPRAAKDYQRARLTRAKTDRVDALGLLDFLARMPFVPWTPPAPQVLGLQQLTRRMEQLKGERTPRAGPFARRRVHARGRRGRHRPRSRPEHCPPGAALEGAGTWRPSPWSRRIRRSSPRWNA